MLSPQEYRTELEKINYLHDELANASSAIQAQNNILRLQTIENRLLLIENQIVNILGLIKKKYQSAKYKPGFKSYIFQLVGKEDPQIALSTMSQEELRHGFELYNAELKFAQSIKMVIILATIPALQKVVEQTKHQSNIPAGAIHNNHPDINYFFPQSPPPVNYQKYIQSHQWRTKAEEAKARAGNRCQICNRSRAEIPIEAHHRTYERLGNELANDITVLCRDCHQLYSTNNRLKETAKRCTKCGQPFTPRGEGHLYCLDCYLKQKRQGQNNKKCQSCGEEFSPINDSHVYCYTCYTKQKRVGSINT